MRDLQNFCTPSATLDCAPAFHSTPGQGGIKVEFSASPDHHDISIYFKDKTGFNFSIEAGFTLKTEYSDWKSGEQRIILS